MGLCNRLAAEVAALKAANERLTPKPMTLEELAAVLRDRKAHGHDDWEAGSTHIYSRDGDLEYSPFGARMRVDQLLRDAGQSTERSEAR